jgi:hypothetical protein
MLQRIQTVWLFLASAALFCLFLFPYVHILSDEGKSKEIKVTGVYENVNGQAVQTEPFLLITIATVILALVPVLIIFNYLNRKRQIMMCYLAIVLILAHYYWLVSTSKHAIGSVQLEVGNFGIGAILPSIAIILILMAIKGVRNDEKLIRSADRLR